MKKMTDDKQTEKQIALLTSTFTLFGWLSVSSFPPCERDSGHHQRRTRRACQQGRRRAFSSS